MATCAGAIPQPVAGQTHPSTSIGTISKIKGMRASGMKVVDIANELHVSPQTIRYYTKE